jgi:uncharacterized protein DUF1552
MRSWNRREFMRNAGMAAVFSPFLSILDPKLAKAATGDAKYLFIFFTNGTDTGAWKPLAGSGASNIAFSSMTEPLAPIKDKLILIDQLDSNGTAGGHAAPGGLTGKNYDGQPLISIDQFVSDGLKANGIVTQVPSLALGGVPSQQATVFYRANRAIAPIASPATAYQAIFGGAGAAPPPTTGGPPVMSPATLRRKGILDLLRGEIGQLNQALGSVEREKLDLHLASLKQLEDRILGGGAGGGVNVLPSTCSSNPAAPGDGGQDLLNSALHLDLAVQAFACDITRVAAVEFGNHQSAQVNIPEVGEGDWHNTFTHGDNPRTRLTNLERWLAGRFVDAANKLKSLPAPDGNGTLFDQTLMVWARDMGDSVIHDGSNMRFVLSGGAGGYLKSSPNGVYLEGNGEAHARVLFTMGDAMGITNFSGFGNPGASGAARTPLDSLKA